MKKFAFIFLLASLAISVQSQRRIGSLTIASCRNVDTPAGYELLRADVEGVSKLKEDEAMQEAMDEAIRQVPGGEFLMNVVFYMKGNRKVIVRGDVWGKPQPEVTAILKPHDRVTWKDEKQRNCEGFVIEVNSDSATVQFGKQEVKILLSELSVIPD